MFDFIVETIRRFLPISTSYPILKESFHSLSWPPGHRDFVPTPVMHISVNDFGHIGCMCFEFKNFEFGFSDFYFVSQVICNSVVVNLVNVERQVGHIPGVLSMFGIQLEKINSTQARKIGKL